jgi:hypothetical protein
MIRKITFLCMLATFAAGLASATETSPQCPSCPPENSSDDVFDPNACVGPTLTSAEAARKFCQGTSQVRLAEFNYAVRMRVCNKFTNCGNWIPLSVESHLGSESYNAPEFWFATASKLGGTLTLDTIPDGVRVNFIAKGFSVPPGPSGTFNFVSTNVLPSTPTDSLVPSSISDDLQPTSWGLYLTGESADRDRARVYPQGIQFTDHCARFLAHAETEIDGSANWIEYQMGGMARY